MYEKEWLDLAKRFVLAAERIAEALAPQETPRERRPAILSTARYTREERDREEFRKTFGRKEQ